MKNLQIGEVYTFDYVSTSAPSKSEKIKAELNQETKEKLIQYVKENAVKIVENYNRKLQFVINIQTAKNKELKEKLKKEFYEVFPRGSKEEKPLNIQAQNLFFRNYNPENMIEGESITALFAGFDYTINGKPTYKWYVFNEAKIEKKYFAEEMSEYVILKEQI